MKNLAYIIVTVLIATTVLNAQTSESPWAVSVGANIVGVQDDTVDSDTGFGVPHLSLSRYIAGGFSIGAQFAKNSFDVNSISSDYLSLDGIVKFNITEGKYVPYLFAGYGISKFGIDSSKGGNFPSTEAARTTLGGLGLNYYFTDNWAINASTSYRSASEKGAYNHLQHVIGVSYNFGVQDSDKDGVSDKKDVCPEIPGLKEFEGCPDTDGDGIPDNKDACPEEAGSAEMNGCPDQDGDGIADNEDACPDKAGSAEMNGCPDSDGDGVADNLDKCPEQVGDVANNGCPWDDGDGDGVADKDDACPEEAGDAANNGCPAVPQKLIDFLQADNSKILFRADSYSVPNNAISKLNDLKAVLEEYPDASITIEGHASEDGSSEYNQKLSDKRANSVKDALIAAGIDANRLETKAYGETKPVVDNNTKGGRAANRRVVFDRRVVIKIGE